MNLRRLLHIASCVFLIVAVSYAILASRPLVRGIRIPVHTANGKIGYIDAAGQMALAPIWNSATPFGADDHATVSVTRAPSGIAKLYQRWILRPFGFPRTSYYRIDRIGNLTPATQPVVDFPADPAIKSGLGEMSLVQRADFRWVLGDGSPAFPGGWQQAMDFRADDPAAVFEKGCWGFINRKGESVIPFRWDKTLGFDGHGRACVAIGRKWGVIDPQGSLVVPLRFKTLAGFDAKNFCAAEIDSGWGFIESNGAIAIPFRYHKVDSFDRFEMAKIQLSDASGKPQCGWIDRSGKSIVEARYEVENPVWAPNFSDHELLPVIESAQAGLIDRKGRTVVSSAHGELSPVGDPLAPGKFWITTLPYRSWHSANHGGSPQFQPTCYDSAGTVIWNGSTLTPMRLHTIIAILSGLIAALLLFVGNRRFKSKGLA